ncbi:MAG TPA: reverse transcriptase domain-containing protein [Pedobacter sp.]
MSTSTPRHTSYPINKSHNSSTCSIPIPNSQNQYKTLEDYGQNLEEDDSEDESAPPTTTPIKRHILSSNWYPGGRNTEAEKPLLMDVKFDGIIDGEVMIDSGCSTEFMDLKRARDQGFEIRKKPIPEKIEGLGGQTLMCYYEARIHMIMDQHAETVVFHLVDIPTLPALLGKSWLSKHNPDIDWTEHTILFRSAHCHTHCLPKVYVSKPQKAKTTNTPGNRIALVGQRVFQRLAKDPKNVTFALQVEELEEKAKDEELEEEETLKEKVPQEYHEYLDLFKKKQGDKLPPHRPHIDHKIEFIPGGQPTFGPTYNLSNDELKELKKYMDENLAKGFIRTSKSPCAAPILFTKKKDGTLRLCVDYRALNKITIKNRYPLPLIGETLDQLKGAKLFTKLDLRGAYNLIRIAEGDEWKTAFRSRHGLHEYLVMPFGLTNAPATFQTYMNDTLREYLDRFCVVYLDDILIYSKTPEEHQQHVKAVLQKLNEAGLYLKAEKCEFSTQRTEFLGYVITPEGTDMDKSKVLAILEWPEPEKITQLRGFLGFANYYRRFIKNYSKIAKPLTDCLKGLGEKHGKGMKLVMPQPAKEAFEKLKQASTTAPVLIRYNPNLETVIEVDSSDACIGGVLSQYTIDPDGKKRLHPVAFYSKKLSPAECNYTIGEKELLAIMQALSEEWHHYCEGAQYPITVFTDHSNLRDFCTTKKLNRREARWSQTLQNYKFVIVYRPGPKNEKADALTRRSGDLPEGKEDERSGVVGQVLHPQQFSQHPQEISAKALAATRTTTHTTHDVIRPKQQTLENRIRVALAIDELGQSIIQALKNKVLKHRKIPLAEASYQDGLLTIRDKLYVPDNEELYADIIRTRHDSPVAGHPGRSKTFDLVGRRYWWPTMHRTIKRYVENCEMCQRVKPTRHQPYGLLKPLEPPEKRWDDISMDFITGLPLSEGYDAILVVVDHLSKMAHYIPCNTTLDAEGFAQLFVDHIFRLHGLPTKIISDRGSIFTSKFWKWVAIKLEIKRNLSTAFHPQTDGQTERINAILEQYLRCYCNYQQDNWRPLLSLAEFAYNNSKSSTTGATPFLVNYGYNPRFEITEKDVKEANLPTKIKTNINKFVTRMEEIEAYCRLEIKYAQALHAEYANQKRLPPPVYNVGDKVWLMRRFIQTTRPSGKLDYKKLGKYEILERVGTHAYKLKLPPSMEIHPVFHVSLLEPANSNPLKGQYQPPPPPTIVNNEKEYEVEEIFDSRSRNHTLQYKVKWVGYHEPTWEPAEALQSARLIVKAFHDKYPRKPSPSNL